MVPGQLRPSFAAFDREKRFAISAIGWLLGLGCFARIHQPSGGWPFMIGLIIVIVGVQLVYAQRMQFVRAVQSQLAGENRADRWFVGNVRLVGPSERDPDRVAFTTTIVQIGTRTVSLWNPDEPSRPFMAFPLHGLDVQVMGTTPHRLRLTGPFATGDTYIALFQDSGLSFERAKRLEELAVELFPHGDRPESAAAADREL